MPRARSGTVTRRRHKKIRKLAKGYYGGRRRIFHIARDTVYRALAYSYAGRKQRKRQYRYLWNIRINAAAREHGLSYSRFINLLKRSGVELDRKSLAEIALDDPAGFRAIVESVRSGEQAVAE